MKGIAEQLREELDKTMGRIRRMGGGVVFEELPGSLEANPQEADQVDASRASEERETSSATRRVLIDKANKLAEALERFQRGKYGTCEECGEPIESARLRATPQATTCIPCQGHLERSARRFQHQDPTHEAH
jgi:RNA polymerase-binding transcription factor DksA